MRGRLLASVLAGAVASVGVLLPTAAASAAPTASIDVAVVAPQQVAVDPGSTAVDVFYSVAACPNGCALVRVRTLRANAEEQQVDLRTFGAGATRTFRVRDAVSTEPAFRWTTSYEVRVFRTAAHTDYTVAAAVLATPSFSAEDAFRYGTGWRREFNSGVTETLIQRSWTTGATATLPASGQRRKVGLIAAKGPNNGIMRVAVNGRTTHTLDLFAGSWSPRQVVATLDLPANAVLSVHNVSPASRPQRDVHVDGLISLPVLDITASSPSARSRALPKARALASAETVDARVRPVQQLPATGSGPVLDVSARVLGCPSGCTIVRRTYDDTGQVDTVLLRRTSPASTALQTLTVTDRRAFSADATYVLQKGSSEVAVSSLLSPALLPETRLTTSYGWVKESSPGALGGTVLRSSTPDTAATYRAGGAYEGRSFGVVAAKGPRGGVLVIYVDGKGLQSVDLYSATVQPRQVVASVDLGPTGRLTLANRTPAAHAGKDVAIDGLVLLDRPDDYY